MRPATPQRRRIPGPVAGFALYARVHFCLRKSHARPRVQRAPGLPCALCSREGGKLIANLGRKRAARSRKRVFVGWVERSDTHQRSCVWRWVSLCSTHPTASSSRSHPPPSLSISRYKPCSHSNSLGCGGDLWFAPINPGSAEEIEPDGGSSKI